jgi:hypothetical protein
MTELRLFLVTAAAAHALGCGSGSDAGGASVVDYCANFTPISGEEGFVLDEGRMTLHPGQEGVFCNPMGIPARYGGQEAYMVGVSGIVSGGTHHFIMAYSNSPLGSPPLCPDTGSGQVYEGTGNFQDYAVDPGFMSVFKAIYQIAFGAGQGPYTLRFPDGYGRALPLGSFESSHHIWNPTARPLDICAKLNVEAASAGEVRFPMATFVGNAPGLAIPPHAEHIIERTLLAPFDMDVVVLMSHAHHFLTRFEIFAYRNGATTTDSLYASTKWNNPATVVHDPPVRIKQGDGMTYRCTFNNTSDTTVMFGVGRTSEMCMPFGLYAYPPELPRAQPPELSAASLTAVPVTLKEL